METKGAPRSRKTTNGQKDHPEPRLGENLFFNRSPILDRKKAISAYRLDFLQLNGDDGCVHQDALDGVLLPMILDSAGPHALADDRTAFLRTEAKVLEGLAVNQAWTGKIVFDLPHSGVNGGKGLDGLTEKYRLCLSETALGDGSLPPAHPPLFVKIPVACRETRSLPKPRKTQASARHDGSGYLGEYKGRLR